MDGSGTYAGNSPYVISMAHLQIPVLPSIVNAALITTVISSGNAYAFNASRSLHALALDGCAPRFLQRLNKKCEAPFQSILYLNWLANAAVSHTWLSLWLCFSAALLILPWIRVQLKSSPGFSSQYFVLVQCFSPALTRILLVSALPRLCCMYGFCRYCFWLADCSSNWTVMSFTWIRFNKALSAQDIDRTSFLPSVSRFQPYAGYWGFFWAFVFLWYVLLKPASIPRNAGCWEISF